MNSLVKDLCKKCESSICENHRGCAFRSLSNDYCDEVENLNSYINQLQQENKQLKEKQDEKLDSIISDVNRYLVNEHRYRDDNLMISVYDEICKIIEKYKEVSNAKE